MNRTTLLAASVIVLSGLIGATPFIVNETSLENAEKDFNASVYVMEDSDDRGLGINADRNLEFGRLAQGTNATKFLNLSVGKKSMLYISSEGNISEVLVYEDRIYFEGDREVELEAKGDKPGSYVGDLKVEFEIPRNQVGRYWLDLKHQVYELV